MAEEKESTSIPLSQVANPEDPAKAPPISPSSSTRKACGAVLQSWVSKKFMTGWYCSENNKRVIHFSTCEVYGKTIGSFLPNDHPLRKNKKERKKVREVGILKKDPEAIREQIEKMERMIYKSQVLQS
ncbi:hypothetical protein ZIOFF_005796 [Zingiber officinale]|uniref:Wbp11/ELF5/Saf1 N-terminal domain-containing protein n=1 Tax=Zingiber officinale TaxID=94328 RepID=A0A8J5IAK7_ZINOF|nr:hypothetical protein ZIOFF_005796 [Zingiber officinale]